MASTTESRPYMDKVAELRKKFLDINTMVRLSITPKNVLYYTPMARNFGHARAVNIDLGEFETIWLYKTIRL